MAEKREASNIRMKMHVYSHISIFTKPIWFNFLAITKKSIKNMHWIHWNRPMLCILFFFFSGCFLIFSYQCHLITDARNFVINIYSVGIHNSFHILIHLFGLFLQSATIRINRITHVFYGIISISNYLSFSPLNKYFLYPTIECFALAILLNPQNQFTQLHIETEMLELSRFADNCQFVYKITVKFFR